MTPLDYWNYQAKEDVTYYPGGSDLLAFSVSAVVERNRKAPLFDNLTHAVDLFIPRGNVTGQVSALDIGQDEVLVRVDPYGPALRCRVTRLLSASDNHWEVRAYK